MPGVSGGVLAVAFGLYGPLMELLSQPRTAFPRYRGMLLPLGMGWCIGFFGVAKGVAAAFGVSETAATWLFIGLIAGTLPALYREAGREGHSPAAWTSLAVCTLGVFGTLFYVSSILQYTAQPGFLWYSFCGALWGLSVVIPGLTSSSVMMALGLYQPMMEGLARLDMQILAACLPAMLLAVLLPARAMRWLLGRFHSAVFHGILGVVAASTAAIVPVRYAGAGEAALSALCCAAGFALALGMEKWDRRSRRVPEAESHGER